VRGVPPEKAQQVAHFLISECKLREIRPSVRLFLDKALKDYELYEAGKCETNWRDLVVSNLEQQLVELQFPTNDLSRKEQVEAERRMVLDIYLSDRSKNERVEQWQARTGKSQAAFYRRLKELRDSGRLPAGEIAG